MSKRPLVKPTIGKIIVWLHSEDEIESRQTSISNDDRHLLRLKDRLRWYNVVRGDYAFGLTRM
jgi:hypothetical protein